MKRYTVEELRNGFGAPMTAIHLFVKLSHHFRHIGFELINILRMAQA